MKKIILVAFLFFRLLSFGQSSNDKVVFYDSISKETSSKEYSFKKIIKEYNLKKKSYEVEYYSKINNSDVLNYRFFVNDKVNLTPNGVFTNFYDSGMKSEVLNFENGKLSGITNKWHKNGKLSFEGEYKIIKEETVLFHYNYWNKNGEQKVKNGNGIFEEFNTENEESIFTGKIKNGLKDGIWTTISSDYPKTEEVYENGVFKTGTIYKSLTNIRKYNTRQVNAGPIGGMNDFRMKLAQNIKKSSLAYNYRGKFYIMFVVNGNGDLVDFRAKENISDDLFQKLIEIVKNTSQWESGIYNGREIKQYFTLPIVIQ